MPVRVKQRGLETSHRKEFVREWESIRRHLIGLLLAWHVPVDASIRNAEADRKTTVKFKGDDRNGIIEVYPTLRPFDLSWIGSLLSQAGFTEPNTWGTWIKTSARTPFITIRGAFSLQPVETKRTQFISLGIRHFGTDTGANALYDEVNRLFALSSFGNLEALSDDEAAQRMKSKDGRYKKDGHTHKQLRGTGKGVDRWPMFVIRIDVQGETASGSAGRDCLKQRGTLSGIMKVLVAMVTGFLTDHQFRPRKDRKRRHLASTDQCHSSALASADKGSPISPKSKSRGMHTRLVATKSHRDIELRQGLTGYTVQLPKFQVDRTRYDDEGSGKWSLIKSGTSRDVGDGYAMKEHPPKKGSDLIGRTSSSEAPSVDKAPDDILTPKALTESLKDSPLGFQNAPHGLESETTEAAVEDPAQDIVAEDTFTWINPMTKEVVSVNSRTGLVVPCPQRPHLATSDFVSPGACGSGTVGGNSGHSKFRRCASTPAVPKTGSWVSNFLKDWENPAFAAAAEQAIPRVSFEGSAFEAHDSISSRQHRCSHLEVEKAFAAPSSALSSRLSKTGLGNAKVISQVDKKFILILAAPFAQTATEQTSAKDDQQILVLIDQHAADERIRVESLLADLCTLPSPDSLRLTSSLGHESAVETTLLPKPLSFQIKAQEHHMFTAHAQHFASWGILYDLISAPAGPTSLETQPCQITVKALPPVVAERCRLEPRLLIELLRKEVWKREENGIGTAASHAPPSNNERAEVVHDNNAMDWLTRISTCPQGILDMVNSRSCRSSIMFNDELSVEECEILVKRLARCKFPFQCAHGRPSMVPLVAVGDGYGLGEGSSSNGGVGGDYNLVDGAEDDFADAWKKWKGQQRKG
ncbi:MAG: hypothetical protein LQ338_004277 [Usnochroma carphineum]|nr:MAG: hypothetical protein LQ338_004277 [Usnochroma carphineum]